MISVGLAVVLSSTEITNKVQKTQFFKENTSRLAKQTRKITIQNFYYSQEILPSKMGISSRASQMHYH